MAVLAATSAGVDVWDAAAAMVRVGQESFPDASSPASGASSRGMPEDDRRHLEEASAVLCKVRAAAPAPVLPAPSIPARRSTDE